MQESVSERQGESLCVCVCEREGLLSSGHAKSSLSVPQYNNILQHTATHCNTLQHTATHCNTLQHTATHCNTLHHTATHCNTLQHTATHCNTLQHTARHCNTLQHTATHCSTLQHTATSSLSVPLSPSLCFFELCVCANEIFGPIRDLDVTFAPLPTYNT